MCNPPFSSPFSSLSPCGEEGGDPPFLGLRSLGGVVWCRSRGILEDPPRVSPEGFPKGFPKGFPEGFPEGFPRGFPQRVSPRVPERDRPTGSCPGSLAGDVMVMSYTNTHQPFGDSISLKSLSGPREGSPVGEKSLTFTHPSSPPPPKLFVLHPRISDVVFLTVDSFRMSAQWIVSPPLLIPWFHLEWIGPSLMLGGGSISMGEEVLV